MPLTYQAVESNLRDSFRVLAAARPSGEVRELAGVSIASLGVTFQMFNAAFLGAAVDSDSDLDHRIVQSKRFFDSAGLSWAFWMCDQMVESKARRRAKALFKRYGLRHTIELPGMVAERLLPPERPLPRVDVRRVSGGPNRAAFCEIGSVCFNVPLSWFREVFENEILWDHFAGYVAYIDSEPVSTAATVIGADVAGVYNVATLPGHQMRGYGEAVMRYALEDTRARCGIEHTVLQSTPQGFHLYRRMGYREVAQINVFAS